MSSLPPDRTSKPKLLFLTKENPFPPAGGAHLRDSQLIRLLSESMQVEILCHESPGRAAAAGLAALPADVLVTQVAPRPSRSWRKAVSRLRPESQADYCILLEQAIRERADPGRILWMSRLGMAKYLPVAKELGFRTILDQHQVETQVHWNNAFESASSFRTAARGLTDLVIAAQCGLFEGKVCRQSDAVVATSDLDASRLLRLAPSAPLFVIPHAIDSSRYVPLRSEQGRTILYTGTLNYEANIEGLGWYLSEVMPRLKAALGSACPRLVVAGSNPTAELAKLLEGSGAELHADPSSLLPFLADAAVVIAPLRTGRSMRFKILEAMAAGRAVVSTPRAADGLLLAPGYDIWIADAADKFASAISKLLQNPELRAEVGAHAAQTIDLRFDAGTTRSLLETLFQRLEKRAPTRE